jgi:hypothetical protein
MNIRLLYRLGGTTSCISHFFDLIASHFHETWVDSVKREVSRISAWKVVLRRLCHLDRFSPLRPRGAKLFSFVPNSVAISLGDDPHSLYARGLCGNHLMDLLPAIATIPRFSRQSLWRGVSLGIVV